VLEGHRSAFPGRAGKRPRGASARVDGSSQVRASRRISQRPDPVERFRYRDQLGQERIRGYARFAERAWNFLQGFNERLRKAYGLLDIFQNVLLALAVAVFAVWLTGRRTIYLYASLALFVAGVMPALTRSYHFFSPPRKTPIFQETVAKARNFPWAEATAVLAFFTGLLQLARALVAILW